MKRVIRKKLNRTVLKKEGTKWIYLTMKQLLPFFKTTAENLEKSKKYVSLMVKDDYLENSVPTKYNLYLTVATNEIRLCGESFPRLFKALDLCECDTIVMETLEKDSEELYLISGVKAKNIIIKNYSKKDVKKGDKVITDFKNSWWFWDNNLTDMEMDEFINNQHYVDFIYKGQTKQMLIKFSKKDLFFKYMNKDSGSVQKQLYEIEYYFNDSWHVLEFTNINTIEFENINDSYKMTEWKSLCEYEEIE